MKRNPLIILVFLSFLAQSCASSANFDVKTVDANSHKPISGVKVEQRATHFTGVKSLEMNDSTLGKTSTQGIFNIGKLNMNSRDYTFSFAKKGYGTMYLVVGNQPDSQFGLIVKQNNEQLGVPILISKFLVIEIPMRRK